MKPEVTILVTHHLNENDKYLAACVRSLQATEGIEIEIIAISDAPLPPKDIPQGPNTILIWDRKAVTVPDKWREALRGANPGARYFMMVSDDVIVSKHTVTGLARALGPDEGIMGCRSNSDQTTRYFTNTGFPLKMTIEELGAREIEVIGMPRWPDILLPQDWVSFYCVMMPKSVCKKVGELDANLEVRYNDADYCLRARKLGIPSLIHLGVFALHFGDKTIPQCTSQEQYAAADRAMKEKYATGP